MHRELMSHPHIGSFSALLLLAFLAAYLLARYNASRATFSPRHIDNQALLLVALSMAGARFFSWLFYFPAGASFWKAMMSVDGGLVFYGGMIFSAAGAILYLVLARLSICELADVWAAPVALGLAIGRVGCFMAGCCWGDVCIPPERANALSDSVMLRQVYSIPLLSRPNFPLAVRFPPETGAYEQQKELGLLDAQAAESLPVHPAQLYEAAAVFALAIFLQRRFLQRPIPGSVFAALGLGYGGIRFLVEFFRADNPPIYFGLTLSQVISIFFVGGIIVLRLRKRAPQIQPALLPIKQPLE